MANSSTDVPASIAGYYYQFLLAVQELSNLLLVGHDEDLVGIEQGADVRVFKQDNKKRSLEAKFYKDVEFNKNHSSIGHTIYNFYSSFLVASEAQEEIDDYEYHTNVPISVEDQIFFERWLDCNCWNNQEEFEYITYIKQSIIRDRLKTERAKKVMSDMECYLQKGNLESIFSEFLDGTSALISVLEQTEIGKEAYECLKSSDVVAKETKLKEIIESYAYTKQRTSERKQIRDEIEQLKKRIAKPTRQQLINAFLTEEMPSIYNSIITYKTIDEHDPEKEMEVEIDLTDNKSFLEFAKKISFKFGAEETTKRDYILDLQGKIIEQLQEYDASLEKSDCEKLINAIIEELFSTTIDDIQGIKIFKLKNMIKNHYDLIENGKLRIIIESYNNVMNGIRRSMKSRLGDEISIKLESRISEVWEKYYEAAILMGISVLNQRFKVNHNEVSIEELLEMLVHISLLEHFSERDLSVVFHDQQMLGANNIELDTNKQYLFKSIKSPFYTESKDVVYDFIDYMYEYQTEKIEGNENVLFFSNILNISEFKIEENPVILDIARVEEQEHLLLLFGDMKFNWSSQIQITEPPEKNKQGALNFIGE